MMAREIKQYRLTQRYDLLCKTFGTTDRHRQNCFYMYMLSSINLNLSVAKEHTVVFPQRYQAQADH